MISFTKLLHVLGTAGVILFVYFTIEIPGWRGDPTTLILAFTLTAITALSWGRNP